MHPTADDSKREEPANETMSGAGDHEKEGIWRSPTATTTTKIELDFALKHYMRIVFILNAYSFLLIVPSSKLNAIALESWEAF